MIHAYNSNAVHIPKGVDWRQNRPGNKNIYSRYVCTATCLRQVPRRSATFCCRSYSLSRCSRSRYSSLGTSYLFFAFQLSAVSWRRLRNCRNNARDPGTSLCRDVRKDQNNDGFIRMKPSRGRCMQVSSRSPEAGNMARLSFSSWCPG